MKKLINAINQYFEHPSNDTYLDVIIAYSCAQIPIICNDDIKIASASYLLTMSNIVNHGKNIYLYQDELKNLSGIILHDTNVYNYIIPNLHYEIRDAVVNITSHGYNLQIILRFLKKSGYSESVCDIIIVMIKYVTSIYDQYIKREFLDSDESKYELAIWLHSKLCKHNHTDMCSWGYEVHGSEHNWNGFAHKTYLDKATELMKITQDIELIKKIVDVVRN